MQIGCALLAVALFVWAGPLASVAAQTGGDYAVALDGAAGRPAGTLRLPTTPARPPAVLLVAASQADAAALSTALAADGVASLRMDGNMITTEATAQWIAWLRNDARFPTVSVFGEGVGLTAAVVSARAARADGVITRGDTNRAAEEMSRLVARVGSAQDAAGISAFARSVPVLGRRGTSAARPATARRSPRRVVMTTIGSVRVSIEWGSPQMRGRDVWGGLVPWNAIWMPGADEATVITTNGALTIGALDVLAGDYSLYTLPSPESVQLIVSRDVGQFHTVREEGLFVGRVEMAPSTRPDSVEGLTFAIDARGSVGTLKLIWDRREYAAPLAAQ